MSGSGFAMGLAIASYEWMAAATLIIVAVFFLPIYIKNHIYTMPQFLSGRYNNTVSTLMAIFWLLVYVFVNLTSIFFLGALAVETITGVPFMICILGLARLFSGDYAWRDESDWLYRCDTGAGIGDRRTDHLLHGPEPGG